MVTPHIGWVLGGGGVPRPGGAKIDGEVPATAVKREMVIHLSGGDKGGGGNRGNGRVHSEKAEHGHSVHSYVVASGPV